MVLLQVSTDSYVHARALLRVMFATFTVIKTASCCIEIRNNRKKVSLWKVLYEASSCFASLPHVYL
jgi:hypothetical protein